MLAHFHDNEVLDNSIFRVIEISIKPFNLLPLYPLENVLERMFLAIEQDTCAIDA